MKSSAVNLLNSHLNHAQTGEVADMYQVNVEVFLCAFKVYFLFT